MKDFFTYKNVVTLLIFITIWVFIGILYSAYKGYMPTERYTIVKDSDNTILLDKKTGLTWRNTWNNDKEKVPCDWEIMEHKSSVTEMPIGAQMTVWAKIIEGDFSDCLTVSDYDSLNNEDKKYVDKFRKSKNAETTNKIKKEMLKNKYNTDKITNLSKLADKYESIKSASEIGKKSLKRFNGFMFVPEINGQ